MRQFVAPAPIALDSRTKRAHCADLAAMVRPEDMPMNAELTREQMLAMLKTMQDQNELLKAKLAASTKPRALSMRVGEKGGACLYGLGRFPVTLYKGQWRRLLQHTAMIEEFLADNDHLLASKD
jgi:hypothetical protein